MATQTAVSRGRFDLNCPSANGEVLSREVTQPPLQGPAMMGEERGLFTVGVAGCGQRQVYQVICPMGGDGCTALEGRTPQVPWGYMGFPLCRRMFQINLIHMRRDANDKAGSFKKGTFSVFSASVVTVFTLI